MILSPPAKVGLPDRLLSSGRPSSSGAIGPRRLKMMLGRAETQARPMSFRDLGATGRKKLSRGRPPTGFWRTIRPISPPCPAKPFTTRSGTPTSSAKPTARPSSISTCTSSMRSPPRRPSQGFARPAARCAGPTAPSPWPTTTSRPRARRLASTPWRTKKRACSSRPWLATSPTTASNSSRWATSATASSTWSVPSRAAPSRA